MNCPSGMNWLRHELNCVHELHLRCIKQKSSAVQSFFANKKLSLGELRSATSGLETVLLSLLHTRVAGQEAGGLQGGTVVRVSGQQSAGNTVTDCTCLAGDTATGNVGDDVKLAGSAGYAEGLVNDELQGLETEVLIDGTAVDGDLAGAGVNTDTSDGLLSAAGAVEVGLCTGVHIH